MEFEIYNLQLRLEDEEEKPFRKAAEKAFGKSYGALTAAGKQAIAEWTAARENPNVIHHSMYKTVPPADVFQTPTGKVLVDGLRIVAEQLGSIAKQATDAASGIQALVQSTETSKISTRKSNPAVKAKRLLGRPRERGSGTEGL